MAAMHRAGRKKKAAQARARRRTAGLADRCLRIEQPPPDRAAPTGPVVIGSDYIPKIPRTESINELLRA